MINTKNIIKFKDDINVLFFSGIVKLADLVCEDKKFLFETGNETFCYSRISHKCIFSVKYDYLNNRKIVFFKEDYKINGPNYFAFDNYRGKLLEIMYINNMHHRVHRVNKPARIVYHINFKALIKFAEYYYFMGKLHRINGPARVSLYDKGSNIYYYYINGKNYSPNKYWEIMEKRESYFGDSYEI